MHGVQGAEKLIELFGRWPSFHDAEVINLVLDRSGDNEGCGPSLVATIRAFDITDEVLPSGFLKLTHECAIVIAFREVVQLQLTDFNGQNVLSGLHIVDIRDRQLERQHFEVEFAGVHGLDARFQCHVLEVLSVTPIQGPAVAPMISDREKPEAGAQVILLTLPPGFLEGLPEEDQRAITAMVGKPMTLVGYDEAGRAELHFADPFTPRTDDYSHTHSIWVERELIALMS